MLLKLEFILKILHFSNYFFIKFLKNYFFLFLLIKKTKPLNISKYILPLILISSISTAQNLQLGGQLLGQAHTLVASPGLHSVYSNPAGVGYLNQNEVAVAFQQHFGVQGLNTVGAWGAFSSKTVNLGFSVDKFGDELYRDARIGLLVSKKIERISLGLKGSYLNSGVKDLSSRASFLLEFGILSDLNSKWKVGLSAFNVSRANLYENQFIPTILSLGLSFKPSKNLEINAQSDYFVSENFRFRVGFNYKPRENLLVCAGVNPYLRATHLGLGFDLKSYNFIYSVAILPGVGMLNQLTLSFKIPDKK